MSLNSKSMKMAIMLFVSWQHRSVEVMRISLLLLLYIPLEIIQIYTIPFLVAASSHNFIWEDLKMVIHISTFV